MLTSFFGAEFFSVTCLWENFLGSYSVKLINQAFGATNNRDHEDPWNPTKGPKRFFIIIIGLVKYITQHLVLKVLTFPEKLKWCVCVCVWERE